MLLQVEFDNQTDTGMDLWFCDNFVLLACTMVPAFAIAVCIFRVGYEIYLTSTGQFTRRVVGSTSRIAFNALIAQHYNKVYAQKDKKKASTIKQVFGLLKRFLINYCW